MSPMVLAELIAWVTIAVADLGFGGTRGNMGANWLQPMDQTQQGWLQPSLDHMLQANSGGTPKKIGNGLLQSLDQTMNFINAEKLPMGPNWPQPSLEHTVQMMSGGKPQDMEAGLRSAVDQTSNLMNSRKPQEIGAGSLQSALDQAITSMNSEKPSNVGPGWLDILLNETIHIMEDVNGPNQPEGPAVQFPLNQTTVTSPHHLELPPSINVSNTNLPIEIPAEISNVTDEASNVTIILLKYGVKVSKDVLDIMNNAVMNNFTRSTLRKMFTALYEEIDPIYRDVYKKKVVPELTGLSEGKQMLLDELLKAYNLTQTDKDYLSYTFVTRALGDLSKEITSGTTKNSEIRKRSKAIEQLLMKQRKAQEEERERLNAKV